MKSISSEDNYYYSFTDQENGIEIIWEFDEKNFSWEILVFKEKEKESCIIPASAKPTKESVNDYDLERLSSTTLKMVDFLSKRLKLEQKNSDK